MSPVFSIGDHLKVGPNARRIYKDVLGRPELALAHGAVIAIRDNGKGEALYTLDTPSHWKDEEHLVMAESHLELV